MDGMNSGVALESVDVIIVVFIVNLLWTSVTIIINQFAETLSCTLLTASNFFPQNF